jgi:hypothetical protein
MDITLREEYSTEFCVRLIAVISHDNETLLKDICRKVPYGFSCGSDDLFGQQKSTPM